MTSLSSGRVATITPSVGSAGTSSSADSHSGGGTTISTTPEPKSCANLQSESRTDIHYPAINVNPSKIYGSKKNKKIVRLMTVLAYMFAVSLAAMVLSLYYLFLWDPYMQAPNNRSFSETSTAKKESKSSETSFDGNETKGNTFPLSASQSQLLSILTKELNATLRHEYLKYLTAISNVTNKATGHSERSFVIPVMLNETFLPLSQKQSSVASFLIPLNENKTKTVSDGFLIEVSNDTGLEIIRTTNDVYRLEVSNSDHNRTVLMTVDERSSNRTLVKSNSSEISQIPP